jgi:hypothetical protein
MVAAVTLIGLELAPIKPFEIEIVLTPALFNAKLLPGKTASPESAIVYVYGFASSYGRSSMVSLVENQRGPK